MDEDDILWEIKKTLHRNVMDAKAHLDHIIYAGGDSLAEKKAQVEIDYYEELYKLFKRKFYPPDQTQGPHYV